MKSVKIFTVILSLVFFVSSCKDDAITPTDDGSTTGEAGVVGVWNLESVEQQNGEISILGQVISTFSSTSTDEVGTFEFKNDGSFTNTVAYSNELTTVTLGQSVTNTVAIPQTTTNGTYVFDKAMNKLDMTNSATKLTQNSEVLELTSSKLSFKNSYTQSVTQNGITSETSADVIITLTK